MARIFVTGLVTVTVFLLQFAPATAALVVDYVKTIVPQTAGDDSISGTDQHNSDEIFASGYWAVGDGGGGYFTKYGSGCAIGKSSVSYGTTSNVVTFGSGVDATGILLGMGVSGTGITSGTTVTSIAPDLKSLTLSTTPSSSGTSITVSGGNGGTVIGDYIGTCFDRVSTSWSAREWGARCDVVVPDASITYPGSGATLTSSKSISAKQGTIIVVPGIGSAPWSATGQVFNGSDLQKTSGVYTGSGYTAGNIVAFSDGGGTATEHVQIVVDSVDATHSNAISTWHFLTYGSFSALPTTTMTASGGTGSGAVFLPVWSGSTYVGTLTSDVTNNTSIPVTPTPALTAARTVGAGWYFGDDDGIALNNALNNATTPPLAVGAAQINLPGNCGTTQQINAATRMQTNPSLVGLGLRSTGLYALATMANVFNRSSANATNLGGGLSNMTVEAMGLTTGPVVEVDGGRTMVFSNLEVRDAIGSGNSVLRCGSVGDANADVEGWFENIRAETRQNLFSGAQFPDSDVQQAGGCHDTFVARIIANNARVANILHVKTTAIAGGHWDNIHTFNSLFPDVEGSALYGFETGSHDYILAPQVDDANFAGIFAFSTYSGSSGFLPAARIFEAYVNCGSATSVPTAVTINTTGTLTSGSPTISSVGTTSGAAIGDPVVGIGIPNATLVTGFTSTTITMSQNATDSGTKSITVAGGYRGIEIGNGTIGATVTGAMADQQCFILPANVIVQDGAPDPSTSVFGNGTASYSTIPSTYSGVTAQRPEGRLTLMLNTPVMNADSINATTVYYAPYVGAYVPIFTGQQIQLFQFTSSSTDQTGLTLALDSSSSHSAYQQKSHLFDFYVALDGTTLRLCTGPAWNSSTVRGTSADIALFDGIWTNSAQISCRWGAATGNIVTCPTNQCTYVGTMFATENGQTCVQIKPAAANGGVSNCGSGNSGAYVGLWNAYNRVRIVNRIQDSTGGWHAQGATTWEPSDYAFTGTNTNDRINFLVGLPVTQVQGSVYENNISSGATPTTPWIGVDFDSTTATPDVICKQQATQIVDAACAAWSIPSLGTHYMQAMEQAATTAGTPFGTNLTTALDWEY